MKALLLETSGAVASLGLADGRRVLERRIESQREQSAAILGLIDDLLDESGLGLADLEAIVFAHGPGSFTGLRVSAAVAQGLGMAAGLDVIGVSSLAAIAQAAWRLHSVTRSQVCVDARMGEVYVGHYEIVDAVATGLSDDFLAAPAAVSVPGAESWTALGNGFDAYPDALADVAAQADAAIAEVEVAAADLLPLALSARAAGLAMPAERALPVYLRDAAAWSAK